MVSANRKKEAEVRHMLAKKKAVAKQQRQQDTKKKVPRAAATTAAAAAATDAKQPKRYLGAIVDDVERSPVQAPPFRFDVHIKNSTIAVEVVLHHVQPKAINVEETTDRKLVVDTTKGFGRKYRLEVDFPEKMVVDSAKGEYSFDSGILTCSFPVRVMPKAVVAMRQNLIEKVTAGKKKRFATAEKQGLPVRSRTAVMEKPADANAAANAEAERLAVELAAKRKRNEKPASKSAPASAARAPPSSGTAEGSHEEASTASAGPSVSANPRKQFVSDADALRLAMEAGKAVKQTLAERVRQAKLLQQERLQRAMVRSEHKEQRVEKQQAAFERFLTQQKAALQRKEELLMKKEKQPKAGGKAGAAKAVKFAASS